MVGSMDTAICTECGDDYTSLARHLAQHPDCVPPSLQDASDSEDEDDLEDESEGSLKSTMDMFAADALRSQVAFDLTKLRLVRGLDNEDIATVKEMVRGWMHEYIRDAAVRMLPMIIKGTLEVTVVAMLERDLFAGIGTAKTETAFIKKACATPTTCRRRARATLTSQTPTHTPY